MRAIVIGALLAAACGDNTIALPIAYTDPPAGGKLRLVKDSASHDASLVLDLVVGDQPLVGYSVGFDLPLDPAKVVLGPFVPGAALPAGGPPVAAMATIPIGGPLAGELVAAQSQKASGAGAVTTDATLAPGAVIFTVELDAAPNAPKGVVFDGTAKGFVLPSGGLRNRAGTTVAAPADVAIGKLEIPEH